MTSTCVQKNKRLMEQRIKNRERILKRTSWISVLGNAILSLSKIVIGLLSGSIAVLGDGIDSATDVVISLITLFTARIVSKPPSMKYAYGYEKAESIATKLLSFIIFFAGAQMFLFAGKRLFFPEASSMPSQLAIYVTIFSILGKSLLAYNQKVQGKKVSSSMLIANAKNMQNDVLISAGVLLGLVFTFVFKLPILDTIAGLIISAYIMKSAFDIFMDSNVDLMDGVKDPSVYERIFEAVESVEGASNPHRVRSRQIGNMYMIVMDIEVDGSLSLSEAHLIAHAVEDSIKERVENIYDIVVHLEPKGECHEKERFGLNRNMFL